MGNVFDMLKQISNGQAVSFTGKTIELDEESSKAFSMACEKLQKESDSSNDANVKYIANYLLDTLNENPTWSISVLQDGKSISESIKVMRKEAEKRVTERRGAQSVIISDQEGFEIILKYFGVSKEE